MMVRLVTTCIVLLFADMLGAQEQTSPAKWSDRTLKVTDGLHVWLDASRIAEARKVLSLPAVKEGDLIDSWADASGNGRDFTQQSREKQPTFQTADGFHSLRFNGRDAYLSVLEKDQRQKAVTVFLVVAPYSNPGAFCGPLGLSAHDGNDFQTGLNIDQGPFPSQQFETLNVEGAGAPGAQNLLKKKVPMGEVLRICITSQPGKGGIATWLNGEAQGTRDREAATDIRLENMIVGARFYTVFGPPEVRGFFEGDIAELLIYDRILGADERASVERYLETKYATIPRRPLAFLGEGKPLVSVDNPPPVQTFVPGFTAKRLPLEMTNINNVLAWSEERIITLGYDGNLHLLRDTDSDGLEDQADLFWENKGQLRAPIGMALTPPGYRHGRGVFVAAKGKCLLITDTDGDNRADREIVVAEGWQEIPHGVDALGVAVDPKDSSVYLGIGTKNFTDPYGRAEQPDARYPLDSERGTILKISPDFKSRTIFATGIRFPVSLRFNRAGDLFCSDQEGATWLPNGNPLDELLHVQSGRHYGFPPRHPKFLPNVIDEPSVFDYAPQHQSTCGMNFNEPVDSHNRIFGPAWWRSDLFMTGYSRGKLYRTKLVHSSSGYVAQNQLFACLNMLVADACVTSQGDLVVAAHSGGPDWGSGPTGKGVLYKISYVGHELPQPVLAWTQSPQEVRVAFDRPLQDSQVKGLKDGAEIEYGRYAAAGDRFESLRPGYQVVQDQLRSPRQELPIHSVQLSADRRTLILATAPHPYLSNYAITLPGLGRTGELSPNELPQHATTDLQYNLHGVEALWEPTAQGESWSGWLPHVDLNVSRQFTTASADHAALWSMLHSPGRLRLRTALTLGNMLRPAVQPGTKLDYELPAEQVKVTFSAPSEFSSVIDGKPMASTQDAGRHMVHFTATAPKTVPIEIVLTTGQQEIALEATWHTAEDERRRPVPLHRFLLPWARSANDEQPPRPATELPELQGDSWARGKQIFFGEKVGCAKCHTFFRQGGGVGPDLSNLPHRDFQSVLRDVRQPNFSINPDYITQSIVLADGRILTGSVRTQGNMLSIGDAQGRITTISRKEIDEIQPSKLSVMPEGLLQNLDEQEVKDLFTFLLSKPPCMPDYGPLRPPPPRSREEVESVLAGEQKPSEPPKHLKIVLVTGRKDHGPGEHDYPAWQKVWQQLMSMADQTTIETASDWPSDKQLETSQVLVFYQQGTWNAERARDLDAFLKRGGGAVYIHYAVDGGSDAPGFAERIGLAWKGGHSKFRHGPLDLTFAPGKNHPISRNFDKLHLHDESYWQLLGDTKRISLLATGPEDARDQPLFWTLEHDTGRVFVSIPGHFSWSFDDPLFRIVLLRGIAWSAGESVDRFNDLVLPGARVE